MSNATLDVNGRRGKGLSVIRTVETCECPRCQSIIPRGNVAREFPKVGAYHPTQRVTMAFCEFCQTIFSETQVLEGGNWQATDGYVVVRNARKKEAFMKRLADVNGDRRVKSEEL